MSRRPPNPAADRAAQNQATLKNLLKLEPNKVCADCKRNKHPRWASWNLGVFICIRCSGIHRGMGTHISRVKSVDLDSWTDEQMKSILSWGNARANKYWEAKLAPGHAPSETKVDNFIRTKYELKRWAMDGERPDPSTLDIDGDDDVPLSVVKEKQAVQRSESVREAPAQAQAAVNFASPQGDLIGGDEPLPRASTAEPPQSKLPPKAEPVPPKSTSTKDSLLGLDFFGEPAAPPRPASTSGVNTPGAQSRPDLKQSILSLYASAPKPQPQPQQQSNMQQMGQFGGMQPVPSQQQPSQGFSGGFHDAFGSLSISNAISPKPASADPFAGFGKQAASRSPPPASHSNAFGGLSGGSFFDPKPSQPAPQAHQQQSSGNAFGDFGSFSSPAPSATTSRPAPSSSAMGDLFDLSSPVTTTPPPLSKPAPPVASNSVFNLSAQNKPAAPSSSPAPAPAATAVPVVTGISGADVWGSSAWTAADTGANPPPAKAEPAPSTSTANDFGWGSGATGFSSTPIVPGASGGFAPAPKVAADEEFGGWTSSTGQNNAPSKPAGGFGGDDELFSNVWQ